MKNRCVLAFRNIVVLIAATSVLSAASCSNDGGGNQSGRFVWRGLNTPCGAPLASADNQPESEPAYTFTGYETDKQLALHDAGARFYHPELCRFTGVDPIDPVGNSAYAYAGNNPFRFVDPDGKQPVEVGDGGQAQAAEKPKNKIANVKVNHFHQQPYNWPIDSNHWLYKIFPRPPKEFDFPYTYGDLDSIRALPDKNRYFLRPNVFVGANGAIQIGRLGIGFNLHDKGEGLTTKLNGVEVLVLSWEGFGALGPWSFFVDDQGKYHNEGNLALPFVSGGFRTDQDPKAFVALAPAVQAGGPFGVGVQAGWMAPAKGELGEFVNNVKQFFQRVSSAFTEGMLIPAPPGGPVP